MARETITRAEYFQLLGLQVLANQTTEQQRQLLAAARTIVGDQGPAFGHTDDMLYSGNVTVDEALHRMGIKVVDDPATGGG